jgi:glycosyltransferase involved in cell wall biosynthesis
VIPNAVDPLFGNASPIEFRERYGAETFVLAVGAIDARKRQLDLVEAIAQTGKRAVIVGDVPGDDYGRAFASKVAANHNIVWIRRLEEGSHMLASAYAAAEAFVVTSRAEGLPLAALEAREAGAPLVMTDLPQHVEVFGGGAEFFRPGDVKALAGILERLPPRGKGPIQSAARTWAWRCVRSMPRSAPRSSQPLEEPL